MSPKGSEQDPREPKNTSASAPRADSRDESPGERAPDEPESRRAAAEGADRLTTMVCISCGAERFFTADIPDSLTCDRCGATVFRSFTTPLVRDEAVISALEEQARSVSYGDPSPETSPDELRDLGR